MNNKNTLAVLKNNELQDNSYIVFSLNSNKYAIDIQNIIEVINLPQIIMPLTPPFGIAGMIEYNGIMIKTVDICPFLGLPTKEFSVNNQLIIVVFNGNFFAIHTEDIENIVKIKQEELQPFPFSAENLIIKEIYNNSGDIVNILDIAALNKAIDLKKDTKSEVNYAELIPTDEKSAQTFKLRSEQLSQNDDVFSFPFNINTVNQYIMFTLGKHCYYLDLKYVKEFVSIDTASITKLPYTKDFIRGLVNIRGEFLVVLDLKNFLNNEPVVQNSNAKIIVAEGRNFNIALLVDEIKYIKALKQIQTVVTNNTCSKYVISEFEEENTLYSIINFEKLLSDENLYINV